MTWTGEGDLPCQGELEMDLPCQGGQGRVPPYQGDLVRVHHDPPCLDSSLNGQDLGLPCQGDQDLAPVPCLDSGRPCPGENSVPWECYQDVRMAPLVLGRPEEFQDWNRDEDYLTPVLLGWSFQKRRLALVLQVPLVHPVPLALLVP